MVNQFFYEYCGSPIGHYRVVCSDQSIVSIQRSRLTRRQRPNGLTNECVVQLGEYFAGVRRTFRLPIRFLGGTSFQVGVWRALQTIPYGETRTYKQVAHMAGTKGYRAVGAACGKNPIEIVVPCHRVVGSNSLGGYSAGINVKVFLLEHEAKFRHRAN